MSTQNEVSKTNAMFLQKIQTPEDMQKTASQLTAFLRDKLREECRFRNVIPQVPVQREDLQASIYHDTPVFMDHMEPNSTAMLMTFKDQPRARYLKGERYEIPFYMISTEVVEKVEQELLVYPYSITQVVEQNQVLDLQETEDYQSAVYVETAVQTSGQIIRGRQAIEDAAVNGSGTGFRGKIQKEDFVALKGSLIGSRRMGETLMISETDINELALLSLNEWGDKAQGEIMINGVKTEILLGLRVVRSIKTEIWQPGNVYIFTKPDFLGRNLILFGERFFLDKKVHLISMQATKTVAQSIANIRSLAKVELYNGQGDGDNGSDPIRKEREVGGGVYNQIANMGISPAYFRS